MGDDPVSGVRDDGRGRGLDELCGLIMVRHHAYLHEALPVIGEELARLSGAPASSMSEARAVFDELARDIEGHLAKEENVLFPALEAMARAERAGEHRPALPFPTVLHPIRMMESEHARIESAMDRLRAITNGFAVPADAPDGWRYCLREFARLDEDLRAHLRAENEVLFPRALELERRLL